MVGISHGRNIQFSFLSKDIQISVKQESKLSVRQCAELEILKSRVVYNISLLLKDTVDSADANQKLTAPDTEINLSVLTKQNHSQHVFLDAHSQTLKIFQMYKTWSLLPVMARLEITIERTKSIHIQEMILKHKFQGWKKKG